MLATLLTGVTYVAAQPPPDPSAFYAGIYADSARSADCFKGQAGTNFDQFVWAWVPEELGVTYLTYRFVFPANLDLTRRPIFNDLVSRLIIVDFGHGGIEWTVFFDGCPTGWILVFRQTCTILDDTESEIRITEKYSLSRDCDFVLGGLGVLNNLSINEPGCSFTPTRTSTWGAIKSYYK
jgi:hypothetical protein